MPFRGTAINFVHKYNFLPLFLCLKAPCGGPLLMLAFARIPIMLVLAHATPLTACSSSRRPAP